jgi:SAM-dependent methyltransferase
MSELLLGCGFSRAKLLGQNGHPLEFRNLITLDFNRNCKPDILCNIDQDHHDLHWEIEKANEKAAPFVEQDDEQLFFKEAMFDEVHAYEVLEHLGSQGDAESFFNCFSNIHRILVPGGFLFATVPSRHSPWAWGDPSHRRVIQQESLVFLDQERVAQNRKRGTQMSDFSDIWNLNFKIVASSDDHIYHKFCLQAVK